MVAIVTPAATLTTTASGSRSSAIDASSSGTIAGLTPISTSFAPRSACAFASGVCSSASESTPSRRSGAAFASVRLVTRMPPVDVDPGLQQSGEDRAAHRAGSEDGDGGEIDAHAPSVGW